MVFRDKTTNEPAVSLAAWAVLGWLVATYAHTNYSDHVLDWAGHCKRLAGQWLS